MRGVRLGVAVVLALGCAAPAHAQAPYPSGPVTLIVPLPGGGGDVIARLISERLSPRWGHPIVVVNKAGAGTIVGTDAVAKARPDGHTLGMAISAFTINAALHASLPYDAAKAFAPIGVLGLFPHIVVVHPGFEAKTLAELIKP